MPLVTLARHAMATRFEIVLHGDDPVALRAAGEEALDEIDRLEARLSLFRSTSEIAHLNALAAKEPVRVTPELFALLQQAQTINRETSGAFDITIAPLVRCWGFMDGTGHVPSPEELSQARAKVGMHLMELNPHDLTVRFGREGVMLDLGAIGKGYAIESAAAILRETGVESALLHGGTSTIYALGRPPEADQWRIAIVDPRAGLEGGITCSLHLATADSAASDNDSGNTHPFAVVGLRDLSLSVSAVWGKSFRANGKVFGHVLDPRTGQPAAGALLSAVVLPSPTETDALSTALLTLGLEGHEQINNLRPGMSALVTSDCGGQLVTRAAGIFIESQMLV